MKKLLFIALLLGASNIISSEKLTFTFSDKKPVADFIDRAKDNKIVEVLCDFPKKVYKAETLALPFSSKMFCTVFDMGRELIELGYASTREAFDKQKSRLIDKLKNKYRAKNWIKVYYLLETARFFDIANVETFLTEVLVLRDGATEECLRPTEEHCLKAVEKFKYFSKLWKLSDELEHMWFKKKGAFHKNTYARTRHYANYNQAIISDRVWATAEWHVRTSKLD